MRGEKDSASKWMFSGYGDVILRGLAGVRQRIVSWKAKQPEIVYPKQVPDAILEVLFEGEQQPDTFLLEVATYPEQRVSKQMLRGAALVCLDQERLPEAITLVLHPRGKLTVSGQTEQRSRLGFCSWLMNWRAINLWDLSADELLAMNEVGLVPWILLTKFTGRPMALLRECRRRIDEQAPAAERGNFLAVAQLLGRLRFDIPTLAAGFGEKQRMIESPFIQDLLEDPEVVMQSPVYKQALADKDKAVAEMHQQMIQAILTGRFQNVPEEVTAALQRSANPDVLKGLLEWAALCPSLEAFRSRLPG